MTLLSGQPLSRLQHSLRGRNVRDMSDAQLRDCIGACTKMEKWSRIGAEARRGWKESPLAAETEIDRRLGGKSIGADG
jgi:hypothetical protein